MLGLRIPMGQDGSESTTVKNPSFLRRVAAGLSTINFYALSGMFYTPNPGDHLHHSVGHGSKVDQSSKPASEPDLEAYAASSNHFNPSIQSSTQISELQELPLFHRSPDSPHLDQPNITHLSNPVAQAFREVELSKAFLPFIMPIATILLSVNKKDLHELLLPSILCLICAALVAFFYGNSFRNMLPKIANAFEQFGTACIYTSFFLAVGCHLPPILVWFPYICFLACILLSVYSCLPVKKK